MVERKKKPVKDKKLLPLSALDRTKAVLSVWAERRKPSEICRSLNVKWAQLRNWEDRALQGMLQALAPRRRREQAPPLSDLERLLKIQARQLQTEYVIYAIGSRLDPNAPLMLPAEQRKRMEGFVDLFVVPPLSGTGR